MPQPSVTKICLKITCLKLHSNFPGANEFTQYIYVTWTGHHTVGDIPAYNSARSSATTTTKIDMCSWMRWCSTSWVELRYWNTKHQCCMSCFHTIQTSSVELMSTLFIYWSEKKKKNILIDLYPFATIPVFILLNSLRHKHWNCMSNQLTRCLWNISILRWFPYSILWML